MVGKNPDRTNEGFAAELLSVEVTSLGLAERMLHRKGRGHTTAD